MSSDQPSDHESLRVKPNDKLGILVAIAACIIYGFYPAASRATFNCGANAVFVLMVTTFARGIAFTAYCLMTRKPLFSSWKNTRQSAISGFWQGVTTGSLIFALMYLQGPIVLTIGHTTTILLLFYMAWKGEIKIQPYILLATAILFVGLSLVVDIWAEQASSNWKGYAFALLSAYAATNRLYVYNHQMKHRNPAIVGAESFLAASACCIFLALFEAPVLPVLPQGWGWVSLSAASLVLGSFGTLYGISLLGSFKWSLFIKLEPVFTCLFSVLFLGEYLKTSQYMGIACVLGGLVYYQVRAQKQNVDSMPRGTQRASPGPVEV